MEKNTFKSVLSNEEINKNFENIDFFSGIMSGLEGVLAYEKETAKTATIVRNNSLPNVDFCGLRKSLNLTQKEFAHILGVYSRTIESWEIGRSNPSPTAKKLLFLISKHPSLIDELI